jgi:hypothetical protein
LHILNAKLIKTTYIWLTLVRDSMEGESIMAFAPHPASATIYQFPVGGRAGIERRGASKHSLAVVSISHGNSWYHEEAVREAELPRKN